MKVIIGLVGLVGGAAFFMASEFPSISENDQRIYLNSPSIKSSDQVSKLNESSVTLQRTASLNHSKAQFRASVEQFAMYHENSLAKRGSQNQAVSTVEVYLNRLKENPGDIAMLGKLGKLVLTEVEGEPALYHLTKEEIETIVKELQSIDAAGGANVPLRELLSLVESMLGLEDSAYARLQVDQDGLSSQGIEMLAGLTCQRKKFDEAAFLYSTALEQQLREIAIFSKEEPNAEVRQSVSEYYGQYINAAKAKQCEFINQLHQI